MRLNTSSLLIKITVCARLKKLIEHISFKNLKLIIGNPQKWLQVPLIESTENKFNQSQKLSRIFRLKIIRNFLIKLSWLNICYITFGLSGKSCLFRWSGLLNLETNKNWTNWSLKMHLNSLVSWNRHWFWYNVSSYGRKKIWTHWDKRGNRENWTEVEWFQLGTPNSNNLRCCTSGVC